MAKKTFHGKVITRKSSSIRYYTTKRVDLEYKPLKTPKVEYTLWFIAEDGTESGYFCTAKEFATFNVPDTTQPENKNHRAAWEKAIKRSQPTNRAGFYGW